MCVRNPTFLSSVSFLRFFLRFFFRFFSASMRMNGFITCLVHGFL